MNLFRIILFYRFINYTFVQILYRLNDFYIGITCADLQTLEAFYMRRQRQIIWVHWWDRIRNSQICESTGLPSVADCISRRRNAIFDHVARLQEDAPSHRAMRCQVNLVSQPPPGPHLEAFRRSSTQEMAINRGQFEATPMILADDDETGNITSISCRWLSFGSFKSKSIPEDIIKEFTPFFAVYFHCI